MLETLSIKNYVIVDQLNLTFSNGFSALTGETGAGKSILIDALSLALGQRSESGVVRNNSDKADISATFDITHNKFAQNWLSENEFSSDDNELILRRIIFIDGKSKAFINGNTANISQVKLLSEYLVDIYSQNSHHSLMKNSTQRSILDNFSDLYKDVNETKITYKAWYEIYLENEEFKKHKESYLTELNELQEKNSEFIKLNFTFGEWCKLQNDHKLLANSNDIIDGIRQSISFLDSDQGSLNQTMTKLQNEIKHLSSLDANLEAQKSIIDSVAIELLELSRELNKYMQSLEVNEGKQNEIELKIQEVFNFCRKYRLKPEDLEGLSIEWQEKLDNLNIFLSEEGTSLALKEAKERYDLCACNLSKGRKRGGELLSKIITEKLNQLSFNDAKFTVNLKLIEPSINGDEQIEFLISTYLGAEAKPIQKVASGGELSRISLAIRVASISRAEVPSMIFDEVDVGIGGSVAEIVGKLLRDLGAEERQIFVITHLPQVAAQSTYHYRVIKNTIGNETMSQIKLLDESARVKEIARMLGGLKITDTTIDHAKEILG
jgi:DNA repair protein RecN (Recombination protein N)